jgi:Pyrimidine dimer DNA glycosylase
MNIFITDPCPTLSAIALDNRRLVKMVLETAQLLSTACRMMLVDDDRLYRKTHFNHPCAVFARKSSSNFKWLVEHGLALSQEFEHRFGKVHASEEIIILSYRVMQDAVANGIGLMPGWPSPFVLSFNCSGFDTGDVFEDYRLCMRRKWETDSMPPKWSRRKPPEWRIAA